MNLRTPLRATLVVALGALIALGACSDGDDALTGPPIPMLSSEASGGGVVAVAEGPLNATCSCADWSCSISVCGYDTATDPRGACCTECTTRSIPPTPQPSCEGGGGGPPQACTPDEPGSCAEDENHECGFFCSCCYDPDHIP